MRTSHDGWVRITYEPESDAAYIYLTDAELEPGRDTVELETPDVPAGVNMDWKDGKIVGLEVLDAASLLHHDLLAQATSPGGS